MKMEDAIIVSNAVISKIKMLWGSFSCKVLEDGCLSLNKTRMLDRNIIKKKKLYGANNNKLNLANLFANFLQDLVYAVSKI